MSTKCCDELGSVKIADGLYLEKYRTFCAGVFGEVKRCYVTDSLTFRQKIGSYDEHETFQVNLNGEIVEAYTFETSFFNDTIDKKTITKEQLFQFHHTERNCITTTPIFGENSLKCDNNQHYWTSKMDNGYYMPAFQFQCDNNDYSNAVFYTDSLNFSVFIGIYVPGGNPYRVEQRDEKNIIFYNIAYRTKIDTVNFETFPLSELKKGKLIEVCSQKK